MATSALVLGIISIILPFWSFSFLSPVSLILAILAIVFGCNGKKIEAERGLAHAGLVCGIIGLIISFFTGFLWILMGISLLSFFWWI